MTMSFGQGLRQWRLYRALTQEELAAKADVSNDTICHYEHKATAKEPSPRIKRKLALALAIAIEDFYRSPIPTNQ